MDDSAQESPPPTAETKTSPTPDLVPEETNPPAPAPEPVPDELAGLNSADFVIHWQCGYGFWSSNVDETLAIRILLRDLGRSGNIPIRDEFPSDVWSGEVLVGHDLMAGLCDDDPPPSPMPVIDTTWAITAGEVILAENAPSPSERAGPLSATALDLVIESPTGQVAHLDGPFNLQNKLFGYLG